MTNHEVHISSLIIHVKPQFLGAIKLQIAAIPDVEIYGDSEEGKIIVVVETQQQKFVTDIIERINNIEHVINTLLVYHQMEQLDQSSEDGL